MEPTATDGMSLPEITKYLGVSPATAARWDKAGILQQYGAPLHRTRPKIYPKPGIIAFGKAVGCLDHSGQPTDAAMDRTGTPVEHRLKRWLPLNPTIDPTGDYRFYLPHVAIAFAVKYETVNTWHSGKDRAQDIPVLYAYRTGSGLDELGRAFYLCGSLAQFAKETKRAFNPEKLV
ncbi:hypothetical protein [Kitasatospora sp. NPDC088783]|uniref:hypothetical protein n=1 Tax=Kitasatospora sp. NPDC088783 TaxID=3364077 RepID=UPI00382E2331